MKLRKLSVVLLALLLAAMAMVPIVSAEDPDPILTENAVTSDDTGVIEANATGPISAAKDIDMTRDEFAEDNAAYFAFLKKELNLDQSAVDKIIDREYSKAKGSKSVTKSAMASADSFDPSDASYNIPGSDIYLWPYTNTLPTKDAASGSINQVFIGKTRSQMDSYMQNNAYNLFHNGIGLSEWGNRNSFLVMEWVSSPADDQLEYGSYFGNRYHMILFEGGFSLSLWKNWCYGSTHYEYWSDEDTNHYLYGNGFNLGREFVDDSIPGSISRQYLDMQSDMSGYADGNGYKYIMA